MMTEQAWYVIVADRQELVIVSACMEQEHKELSVARDKLIAASDKFQESSDRMPAGIVGTADWAIAHARVFKALVSACSEYCAAYDRLIAIRETQQNRNVFVRFWHRLSSRVKSLFAR